MASDHPIHAYPIHQWLKQQGITGDRVTRFISDVLPLLAASPLPDPGQLCRRLEQAGWSGLDLDAAAVGLMVEGFEQAGLLGVRPPAPVEDTQGLGQLLEKIHQDRGTDFRGYAKTSLARRISRRMAARQTRSFEAYAQLLDRDPGEYGPLFDDLTVTVTRFFRNRTAFAAFERAVKTVMDSGGQQTLRVWSVGCATGQEPYSIAMCLSSLLEKFPGRDFRVLATDIDAKALDVARNGVFDPEAVADVPRDWQARYFDRGPTPDPGRDSNPNPDRPAITKEIRGRVRFESHNIVSDPVFDGQDMIVCRNVMIYFNLALQMRVAKGFHRALNPRGYLLLGRYEMLLKEARRQFACVDFDARLYRKK
ncbi:MAG: protein-glutamate O-methyltransferase CheR [Desulfobacter sp.]